MTEYVPRIALTPGEPAGIGPDLCVLIAQQALPCELVVFAEPAVLSQRALELRCPLQLNEVDFSAPARIHAPGTLGVHPIRTDAPVNSGELKDENARYVLRAITRATKSCLSGQVDALVTGPVHKGVINQAGIPFTGHTEFIAKITGGYPVMMLATPGLRVALATTHLPVKEISRNLTHSRIKSVLTVLHRELQYRFGITTPRILVCGLNPHAGENGHLGSEEIAIIEPALASLRESGMLLIGPLPADTLFTPKYLETADAVLAMFHDQGLPVLKYAGFGRAVNITLGIPIIRTSVDHGTALDLAGSGQIDTGSLQAAIETAAKMVGEKLQNRAKVGT